MFKKLVLPVALATAGLAHAQSLPKAPLEVAQAFERHFNAADLGGLLTLYGKGAVFVPTPGTVLSDAASIRGGLEQFLAAKLPIRLTVRHIYQAGDTALIIHDWAMEGSGADGKPMKMTGSGADVVTRQADGTWLYVIDNPLGVAPAQR